MTPCYSLNKICASSSGMTPCAAQGVGPGGITESAMGPSPSALDCMGSNGWFWVLTAIAGLALISNNNGSKR